MKKESLEALGAVPVNIVGIELEEGLQAYAIPPLPAGPEILHQGRYRLYKKPDGTLRIQYRRDGADKDDFFELPAAMVRLAEAANDGSMSPIQMMHAAMQLFGG
jgi:hypothetical protein